MNLRSLGVRLLITGILPGALIAQRAPARNDGDWPMFLHDLAGTRYSPLSQINTGNVSSLAQSWFYAFNREGKTIRTCSVVQKASPGTTATRPSSSNCSANLIVSSKPRSPRAQPMFG